MTRGWYINLDSMIYTRVNQGKEQQEPKKTNTAGSKGKLNAVKLHQQQTGSTSSKNSAMHTKRIDSSNKKKNGANNEITIFLGEIWFNNNAVDFCFTPARAAATAYPNIWIYLQLNLIWTTIGPL